MLQHILPSCAVLIFMETTEAVCFVGIVPSDNSNFKMIFCPGKVFYPRRIVFVLLTGLVFLSHSSAVHFTLEIGSNDGLWRLYAGTV